MDFPFIPTLEFWVRIYGIFLVKSTTEICCGLSDSSKNACMRTTDCFDNVRALSCAESHSTLGGICGASDTTTGALGEEPGLWAFDGLLFDHTVMKLRM